MMRQFRKRKTLQDLFNKKTASLPSQNKEEDSISSDLSDNEQQLKKLFEHCSDFVIRPVFVTDNVKLLLIYLDGLIDTNLLDEVFLKPMIVEGKPQGVEETSSVGKIIGQHLIAITQVKNVTNLSELVDGILKANVGVVIDGEDKAMLAELPGFEKRSIEEPATEVTIRGPKDGFTESLRTNTTLLRRRIRSTKLKFESFTIGELSQTDVVMAYLDGIAPDSLLEEVRTRIGRIELDALMGSEMLEEFIEDVPYSPFPQIQNTERPDILIANLLEGRIGIIVDNTPFALVIPMTFWSGLQAADDYYERFIYTTFIRLIRYVLFNISLFLPSLYVALSTFHPKLIPTSLLFSVAAAREGVPFPAMIEAFMMEFVFEGLREAGVRLPKAIGSAVSIVGALVIGQAAVQAGIVSAPMVIVVATTGISSFSIPRYNFGTAIRIIRFVMLILAGALGLYGIVLGFIALTIHLVSLRSFGVPYFSPVAPQIPADLKDVIIRLPRWALNQRPTFLSGKDKIRFPKGQKQK
ncbi:spore germination protein [Niallia oryzisoli]|uniref:spore germination protein n=1 Tax=Niallia oryzisoli TaxID=1737571 RepID=UPI003735AD46